MLNFKVAAPIKSSKPTIYLARYINKQWYVKVSGNLISIKMLDPLTSTVFYSTPENPSHEPWTKRTIIKGKFNIAGIPWWSTLFHGMRLEGYVKNGEFTITKMWHGK